MVRRTLSAMRREHFAVGIAVVILGAGSLWDGLYAPAQQLVATIGFAAALLLVQRQLALSRLEAGAWLVLAVSSALPLAGPAPSAGTAAHGPLLVAGWFMAMSLGRTLGGTAVERSLSWAWAGSAALMAFVGLATISYLPLHHSRRLASLLGYPVAVGVLGMLGAAGALTLKPRWTRDALLYAGLLGVLLSGSRGVWGASLLLVAYLWLVRRSLLRDTALPALGALAAALWAGPAVVARLPLPGLSAALLLGLTVVTGAWFHDRLLPRLAAAAAQAAAAALAPGWPWLMGRVGAIPLTEGSSVERLTFLLDGLRMMESLPLGAGYRAWSLLHLTGSKYAYYSAEAHSAVIDLGLAFGWAGLAAFLLLLLHLIVGLRKGREWPDVRVAVMAGLAAMALHSLVDWELSYAVFAYPLFMGLGLLAPERRPAVRVPPAVLTGVAGVALAGAALLGLGDAFTGFSEVALSKGAVAWAQRHAAMATGITPFNGAAHAARGKAYSAAGRREEAIAAFEAARRYGRREPWYAELHARELMQGGPMRWREAALAYREMTRLWPWHIPAYEAALDGIMDMTVRAVLAGESGLAADLRSTARQILAEMDAQKAKEPPGMPRRPMRTDAPTIQRARTFFNA